MSTMTETEDKGAAARMFKRKLYIIGAMRLIDSMNVNMIMPYGLQLASRLLNKPTESPEVATAFALLLGLYSLFEIVFSPVWGMLADMMGRRPILLIGIAGSAVAPVLLSLGSSFWVVLFFRALDGFFCGNQAILRTYLGEIVDKSNEASSFSFLVLCFVLGLIAGPFLGGLAFPAAWAPEFFSGTVFEDHPVLLPNLLFGICATIVSIIGFIYLEETLPSSKKWKSAEPSAEPSAVEDAMEKGTELSVARNCCYSLPVLQTMLTFCGLAGAIEAQNTILVLVWQYAQASGGFGLTTQGVSMVLVSGGLGPILCHLAQFNPLFNPTYRLGMLKTFVLGFAINSLIYGLYPVYGLVAPEKYGLWRYVVLGLAEFIGMIGTFFLFTSAFVFMNRASEGLNRATVNGWANSGRALSRAVAPLVASQLFQAIPADWPLARYLPFYVTSASLALCLVLSWTGLSQLSSTTPALPSERSTECKSEQSSVECSCDTPCNTPADP